MRLSVFLFLAFLVMCIGSCKQADEISTDPGAQLSFSVDTLQFDTIFTSIGSTTLNFRFYNPNDNAVSTDIRLGGGNNSYFRLNIDGYMRNSVEGYEIRSKDSVYIFVELTIDPTNQNTPMVVEDSIIFYTNGNQQTVKLIAYGQDVYLYVDSVIDTRTWVADKPYLIYNSVLVDSAETLTIEPGAMIYFHKNSSLLVQGTLRAEGSVTNPITFQADRLETWYDDIPGQWGAVIEDAEGNEVQLAGIHFLQGSMGNVMDHTLIKNAVSGIGLWYYNEADEGYTLTLSNSQIQNMSYYGIQALTSRVYAYNNVIANCGSHAVLLIYGGDYAFYHTTIANYFPSSYGSRSVASLAMNNYYVVDDVASVFPFQATFANCIIDGSLSHELVTQFYPYNTDLYTYEFDHCLMKLADTTDVSDETIYQNIIRVESPDSTPRYVNKALLDFRLDTLSAAINRGNAAYASQFPLDKQGVSRQSYGLPDIGAFERVAGDTIP